VFYLVTNFGLQIEKPKNLVLYPFGSLEIDFWNLFGVWDLEFGI
jgi:hypothetical protein